MPRGSRLLDEPTLYRHPDTGKERTAVSKVEAVTYEAAGYKTAASLQEIEDAEARSAAAKKAAATRRKNATAAKAPVKKAAAKSPTPTALDGAAAAGATTTKTTEPNSGSGE